MKAKSPLKIRRKKNVQKWRSLPCDFNKISATVVPIAEEANRVAANADVVSELIYPTVHSHMRADCLMFQFALSKALEITPRAFRAHALLENLMKRPHLLPEALSRIMLNLSSRDESILRETLGTLELTQQR